MKKYIDAAEWFSIGFLGMACISLMTGCGFSDISRQDERPEITEDQIQNYKDEEDMRKNSIILKDEESDKLDELLDEEGQWKTMKIKKDRNVLKKIDSALDSFVEMLDENINFDPVIINSIVTKVVDGDTVDIEYNKGRDKTRIRILGLDTPETKHPRKKIECYGPEASDRAKHLLKEKFVGLITENKRGKYGRLLGYIMINGEDYGESMIREGYAWHYDKFKHPRLESYAQAQEFARINKLGLWNPQTCNGEHKPRAGP